jgi:hypothetical protein
MKLFGKIGILGKRTFVRRDEIRSRDLDQAKFCDRIYLLSIVFLEKGRPKLPNLGNVRGSVSIAVLSSAITPFHRIRRERLNPCSRAPIQGRREPHQTVGV